MKITPSFFPQPKEDKKTSRGRCQGRDKGLFGATLVPERIAEHRPTSSFAGIFSGIELKQNGSVSNQKKKQPDLTPPTHRQIVTCCYEEIRARKTRSN